MTYAEDIANALDGRIVWRPDEDRRLSAVTLRAEVAGTGGNCMAVCVTLPDGEVLITDGDAGLPESDGQVWAGHYDQLDDGDVTRGALFRAGTPVVAIVGAVVRYLDDGERFHLWSHRDDVKDWWCWDCDTVTDYCMEGEW